MIPAQPSREARQIGSRRTAWALVSIAAAFFFGIMLRYWLLK